MSKYEPFEPLAVVGVDDPLEAVIEYKATRYAKRKGLLAYKFKSPAKRSVPDRLFIHEGGASFFIEFKRLGKKPTPAQATEIKKLRDQGATVYVCDNIDSAKEIIDYELMMVIL